MKALLIVCIAGVALAQPQAPAKAPTKGATAPAAAPAPAKMPPASPALLNPANWKAKAPDLYRIKFATTHGDFVVEVHRDWAPIGADRLYNLVKAKFFTDSSFYRYSPGFIVQFGVPANPAVTTAWENATIKDDPVKESNKKGTITFAKPDAPNHRTNDFFINLRDNAPLDGMGFAPLGTVTEGMDVVEGLYSGYGEMKGMPGGNGPDQQLVMTQGKPYLDKNFPKLDSIKTATIIFPESTAPATKSAPATKAPAAATKSTAPPAATKK